MLWRSNDNTCWRNNRVIFGSWITAGPLEKEQEGLSESKVQLWLPLLRLPQNRIPHGWMCREASFVKLSENVAGTPKIETIWSSLSGCRSDYGRVRTRKSWIWDIDFDFHLRQGCDLFSLRPAGSFGVCLEYCHTELNFKDFSLTFNIQHSTNIDCLFEIRGFE
jgi:hypothetical protein